MKPLKKVAIACQGGGSHTAFTAGVLIALLTSPKYGKTFRITALTGTSGGALCAGIVWSRLLPEKKRFAGKTDKEQGEEAAQALREFWMDLACEPLKPAFDNSLYVVPWRHLLFDYMDAFGNAALIQQKRMSPFIEHECKLVSRITKKRMLELLARYIPIDQFTGRKLKSTPLLRIGATKILEGYSGPICVEQYKVKEIPDKIHTILLASASIPPLFQPTIFEGEFYWDGLYSHNPPIDCLTRLGKNVPDEIWVIQINPERCAKVPDNPSALVDRRNELTGNLSLATELYHINSMNRLLRKGPISKHLKKLGYRPIKLRVVSLDPNQNLDLASKFERSRKDIELLMALGENAALRFFCEESEWKMATNVKGIHNAAVDPKRIRTNAHSHRHSAKQPAFSFCSTNICPGIGFCNTCQEFGSSMERIFNLTQRTLDSSAPWQAVSGFSPGIRS